jgi:predicted transposase YdaD
MIKGEAIGIAKGEAKENRKGEAKLEEIALKMLRKEMSVDDTSEMTGLSKSQIEELANRRKPDSVVPDTPK